MNRRIVNLHLEGDQTVPAESWTTPVPGLIITPAVTTHRVVVGKYCVSHEKSGTRISQHLWDSVEAARYFSEHLADFADWSQGTEQLGFSEDDSTRVNEIVERIQTEIDTDPTILVART